MEATQTETFSNLPTVEDLVEKLGRLYRAQRAGDADLQRDIETEIVTMVPLGPCQAYLGDDLTPSVCEVISVKRKEGNTGANLHTFCVKIQEWERLNSDLTLKFKRGLHREIELCELLTKVNRRMPKCGESQYVGDRIWPL